jgi:RimJ/RimL family protein N-acetyltransferase
MRDTLVTGGVRAVGAAAPRGWPLVQLSPRQFARVAPLFDADLPNRPMLESVLADRNPGWVFADFEERPTAAVVVSRYSFTYLGGRPDGALLDFALGRSAPVDAPLVISASDPATTPASVIAGGRTIDRIEFSQLAPTWQATLLLPEGLVLQPMTLAVLEQCLWKEEVLADCGTLQRFLDIGFGVCGMMNGLVVSEAYASVPGDRAYEIGAIVRPEFRRRGLAYATCAVLIDECRRRKYETIWSCHRVNEASARLARKLGYRRERPYRFWQPAREV